MSNIVAKASAAALPSTFCKHKHTSSSCRDFELIVWRCWTKPPSSGQSSRDAIYDVKLIIHVDIDDFERLGNPAWNWKTYQHYAHKAEKSVKL
jgi:hypothetical protein